MAGAGTQPGNLHGRGGLSRADVHGTRDANEDGSAHAEACDSSSKSCWSLRGRVAYCRRLGRPLCAAAVLFGQSAWRDPRRQRHGPLVVSAAEARDDRLRCVGLMAGRRRHVRSALPGPWSAAMCSGLAGLARRMPRPTTASARAACRVGGERRAAGASADRFSCGGLTVLARRMPGPAKAATRAARTASAVHGVLLALWPAAS